MAQGSVMVAGFEEAGGQAASGLQFTLYAGQDPSPGNGATHFQDVFSHLT